MIAILVSLCCGVIVLAQEEFELKRPDHPRLETTPEGIERLRREERVVKEARRAADKVLKLEYTTAYRQYCVSVPQANFPPPHDDGWPYWSGLCGNLAQYLHTTARAYALTHDEKYFRWCRSLMLYLAAWQQWTDPDYGSQPCLDTHSLTRGMCLAYDYLYHRLSERERDRIREAIATKGAEFIYEYGNDEQSYVHHPSAWPNGYAMINAALGIAGLTFLGEHERAQPWLTQALDKLGWFLDEEGGIDGGLIEGFSYGSAAIDNFTYLLRAAHAVVGVNVLDHPYLSQAIYFPAYFVVPGGGTVANFGDNGGPTGCPPTLRGLARALMEMEQSPVAAWYLKKAGEAGEMIEELSAPPEHLPLARYFRSVDWVALRSGWGSAESLLAFKCGHVAHHNHLDQNSFILAWGREWLLNDPGYQIYDRPQPPERNMTTEMIRNRHEYTFGTPGHNAILVDGKGQTNKRGHIVGFATTRALGYAAGDASQPYQEGLKRYLRHVVSVPPDYYAIFDEIETYGAERQVEILLHTPPDGAFTAGGLPLEIGDERPARKVTVARAEGEATVRFIHPQEMVVAHRQWPDCEPYGHFLALYPHPLTHGIVCWSLRPGPVGQTSLDTRPRESPEGTAAMQARTAKGVDTLILKANRVAGLGTESGKNARPTVNVAGVSFDGRCALVRQGHDRAIRRYGLVAGNSLRAGELELVASDAVVDAGAILDEHSFHADIETSEAGAVTLHCPVEAGLVQVDGVEQPIEVSFDTEAETLTLALPAGRYTLHIRSL